MRPTRMEIAVIVPARNEGEQIDGALASVGDGHEIIVVDGGSSDDTKERAYAKGARVVDSPPGRARQMNAGAATTRAEILLFLHADTWLPEGWADAVRGAVEGGAVAGRFDVELRGRHWMLRVVAAAMNRRSRWSQIYTGDQAIFARRSAFEALGGYESIPLMEDIAFSRSVKRLGKIACLRLRVSTSGRRWEERGPWRTIALMWWLRFAYFVGFSPDQLARWYR